MNEMSLNVTNPIIRDLCSNPLEAIRFDLKNWEITLEFSDGRKLTARLAKNFRFMNEVEN